MAEWTLMNPPFNRPGPTAAPGEPGSYSAPVQVETESAMKTFLAKPDSPLFLWLGRTSATTITLTHGATDDILYKIRDTGRGSLSSKPDYEFFRQTSNTNGDGVFVGSIRFGKRGTEIKMPLSKKLITDIEKFICAKKDFNWNITHAKRNKQVERFKVSDEERKASTPDWIMILDCYEGSNTGDDASACVKLFDTYPNGRFEVWDQDIAKCAKQQFVGSDPGDWDALDEMVTVAFANLEKTRRKMMTKDDPRAHIGIAGLGMGGAVAM